MNEIEGSDRCIYEALGDPDAGEMRAKAEYVMKIGMLLETSRLSQDEVAQKLGLSQEELNGNAPREISQSNRGEYLGIPKPPKG